MPKSDGQGFYEVPQDYEALWGADGSDESWYVGLACAGDRALDLGCGTGRLSLALARRGVRVCGVDASAPMLAQARLRAHAERLAIDWVQGDWLRLELERGFELALLPYNGLQHILDLDQVRHFLASVRDHLAPQGRLALDLHVPQASLLARDPDEWFGVDDGPLSPGGWRVMAEQSRWDPVAQVLTQRWKMGGPQGQDRLMELPMRQYFPQELRALLEGAGFKLLSHAGGFLGQALAPGCLRQVLVAART